MRMPWLFFGILCLVLTAASGCSDARDRLPAGTESPSSAEKDRHVVFLSEFTDALAKARQMGKPLLVFFSTDECIYCHQMFEKTFHDHQIVELAENFVCVRVDAGQAPELCQDFHIQTFPTVQFITSDGAPLQRVLGKKEPEALAVQMQAALQNPHSRMAYLGGDGSRH